jgi:hypothetical protein
MTATKTVAKKKAATKTSRKKAPAPMVTLSSIYASRAAKRDSNTTDAAKLVRSQLRSNFAKVCELSPNIRDHKKEANDGNRWPTHVTSALAEYLNA